MEHEDKESTRIVEMLFVELEKDKPKLFSTDQLHTITSDFSENLGSGAFGDVYKGVMYNKVQVAVKVIKGKLFSDDIKDQFEAEVSTLGRTHHKNLVRLYGFCFEPDMKALVYEFMENRSLDKFLRDNKSITWDTLYNIVTGTANALSYLHEYCQPRIIHYDIKPSNILLDSTYTPKVGDFGLAKHLKRDISHVTLPDCRGTRNYIAPELWTPHSKSTDKCDVYSYGMMLFDILRRGTHLSGKEQTWFPKQVWEKFNEGRLEELMIDCGIDEKDRKETKRIMIIALICVQHAPQDRPSMSQVVRLLEAREEVELPMNPWNLDGSSIIESGHASSSVIQVTNSGTLHCLGPWGGLGGGHWDDGVFPMIKQIQVFRDNKQIRAIQIEYGGKDGQSIWSERHGYTGTSIIDKIELKYPSEFLTRITGFYGPEFGDKGMVLVKSLSFYSNMKKYGPFGIETKKYFTSGKDGKILGFHGRRGAYVDAVGAHTSFNFCRTDSERTCKQRMESSNQAIERQNRQC